jgi:hypothetical protein
MNAAILTDLSASKTILKEPTNIFIRADIILDRKKIL